MDKNGQHNGRNCTFYMSPMHPNIRYTIHYSHFSYKHREGESIMPREVIPPAAQSLQNTTILIVEDDKDIGQFLQQLIEDETPYHTEVIGDGQQALEQAPNIDPCLMLLDYRLPGINGLELYDRLQELKETRGVPAIMMSANLPVEELEKRGIYQIRKPMDIGGVIRMITHAIATFEEQRLHEQYNRA
jgi:two-component system response regulator (stage 0 sporulation protein F)